MAVVAGGGRDLVLFEIHARRVAATAAVSGTAAEATMEVSRLLVKKADQLGPCVGALLEKRAAFPGTKIDDVERIWPVVVSVGHVMQTTNLWDYVRRSMDDTKAAPLSQSRVQPLQLMDIEDYEKLMGLVEAGESLPAMLAHKINGPYRERDFAAWLHSPGAPSDQARLTVLKQRWQEMADRVTLLSDQAARAGSGGDDDGNQPAD
ncbi:MAG TPA: hypothetical protein VN635_10955 [Conexibacter sp.]|nr:hypothetical protein [Conexibacter sp.]